MFMIFLFISSVLYCQENKVEKFKRHLNKFYTELEIDYNKQYDIAEILTYHQNTLSSPHYISPKFAIYLFTKQINQFQFKNEIF